MEKWEARWMGNRDGNAVGGYNDECACMRAEVLAGKQV